VQLARKQGVPVRFEDAGRLTGWPIRKTTKEWWRCGARAAASLEDILANANASGGNGQLGLIVAAGWSRRSAQSGRDHSNSAAAGAHGVVIPERRAAGLTDTVARASAGALRICRWRK